MTKNAGELLSHEEIETSITGAKAWRVRYSSKDYLGNPTESTGLVIAPTAAGTNRPILTWCHGTTGLGDAACPSAQPDPVRELTVYFSAESTRQIDYGIPGLQGFIDAGWVVCATDYQGLGTPGMHNYTVNRTNGLDGLNLARAVGSMGLDVGKQLGAMGWSQGAGAAAALAELDAADFGDLTLVGTVPMSPGIVPRAVPKVIEGALAQVSTTTPPDGHLVMLLVGTAAAHKELQLSDLFTPLGINIIETAWNTQPVHHLNDTIDRMFRLKGAIMSIKPGVSQAWANALFAGSAMANKPVCPVFVCSDTFDGGTVVPVPFQQAYIAGIQALGGDVSVKEYPNDDHFSLPTSCVADAQAWMAKQFT